MNDSVERWLGPRVIAAETAKVAQVGIPDRLTFQIQRGPKCQTIKAYLALFSIPGTGTTRSSAICSVGCPSSPWTHVRWQEALASPKCLATFTMCASRSFPRTHRNSRKLCLRKSLREFRCVLGNERE